MTPKNTAARQSRGSSGKQRMTSRKFGLETNARIYVALENARTRANFGELKLFITHASPQIRLMAVKALGSLRIADKSVRDFLMERLGNEPNEFVKKEIVQRINALNRLLEK